MTDMIDEAKQLPGILGPARLIDDTRDSRS